MNYLHSCGLFRDKYMKLKVVGSILKVEHYKHNRWQIVTHFLKSKQQEESKICFINKTFSYPRISFAVKSQYEIYSQYYGLHPVKSLFHQQISRTIPVHLINLFIYLLMADVINYFWD